MDKENQFASCLGWIVAWVSTTLISVTMDGWALSTIWNWFIPPIFHLVSLTMMQAVGLAMVFSLFTRTNKIDTKKNTEKKSSLEIWIETTVVAILTPSFSVFLAWIVWQIAF